MFRTIQVLLIAAIAIAMILLFRRKLHKEKSLIAGLLLCLLLAAVVSNGIVELIPLPTDPVIVTATGEKNEAASGNEAYLINYIVGGTEYEIQNATEGKWFWKGDVYMWRNENDPRQPDGTTRSITMQIPYGRDRSIQFGLSKWNGIVEVTYGGETQAYDLFKSGDKNSLYVPVPDTEAFALYSTKLLRLAAFLLIAAAIMAYPVFCTVKYDDTAIKGFWAKHWDKLVYISIAVGCFFVMFESGKSGSFWLDEVWTLGWIYEGFPDKSGLIWFWIYRAWFYLVPYGQEFLLIISELLVMLTIYFSGLIGRLYKSKQFGILLSAISASSLTIMAQCGEEFRPYAFLLFSIILTLYLFIKRQKNWENPKISTLILYSIALMFCMDAHLFGLATAGLIMTFDFLFIIIKRAKANNFLEFIIPLIYGVYWLTSQFIISLSIMNNYTIAAPPTAKDIVNCIIWLCGNTEYYLPFILLILGVCIGVATIADHLIKKEFDFNYDYIMLTFLAVPFLLFSFNILYSTIINPKNPLWVARYMIPAIPFFEFYIGLALDKAIILLGRIPDNSLANNSAVVLTSFVVCSFCIVNWCKMPYEANIINDYKGAAEYLMLENEIYSSSTLCYVSSNPNVNAGFEYYLTQKGKRDPINHISNLLTFSEDDFANYDTIYVISYKNRFNGASLLLQNGYIEEYNNNNNKLNVRKWIKGS